MRVAIVRGHGLNPFEMQGYTPLLARGFDLTAVASKRHFFESPPGLKVVRLASPIDRIAGARGIVRTALEFYAYRRGIADRLDGLERLLADVDIAHTAETFCAATAQAANVARAGGAKLVVTSWENIPFLEVDPAFERYRSVVLREASAFVAVTPRARDALLLEGAPAERIHVIPAGVDLGTFKPGARAPETRAALGIPEDALVFLFAARLTWEKGLLDSLHAMALQDLEKGPARGAHLIVLGKGELEPKARERARRLGLEGRVHFLGHVPYARTPDYYRASDAFLLGSLPTRRWQEQFGMVLVEALASGLPIAVAESGSIHEVVGEDALLVRPGDARAMATALSRLADPATRRDLARRGRARAERLYDGERVADQLERVYRSLA